MDIDSIQSCEQNKRVFHVNVCLNSVNEILSVEILNGGTDYRVVELRWLAGGISRTGVQFAGPRRGFSPREGFPREGRIDVEVPSANEFFQVAVRLRQFSLVEDDGGLDGFRQLAGVVAPLKIGGGQSGHERRKRIAKM